MSGSDVQIPFPDHISHPIDDVNITKILAITTIGGRLIHYVQLEGGKKTLMPSTLTNVLVPQLVIEFYQNQISFVNIYNQKIRPIKKVKRRYARKKTNPRISSTKLSPTQEATSSPKNVPSSCSFSSAPSSSLSSSGKSTNTSNNTSTKPIINQQKPPSPPKSKSFLQDIASSLAKSLSTLQQKASGVPPPPKQLKSTPTPEFVRPKPRPLSKQQQSTKKPLNS